MIFLSILIFILAMSLPFFKIQITPIFFTRIAALVFIYAGALTFNTLHIQSIGSGIGIFSSFFQVTYFSLFIETFLYLVAALILLSWPLIINYNNKNIITLTSTGSESKEYSLVALFSTLGGSLLLSSGDLLSMYLSIELQSFALYILATIYRDSSSATGAGLKYFLLGGLSSCLILLGASIIYSFTGLTNFESLYSLISVISMNNLFVPNLNVETTEASLQLLTISPESLPSLTGKVSQGLSLGIILILVGFLFKIAGAPFHNWAPDVYDESPTNVTIWLTIMPKITIIIFLLELELGLASQLVQPILNELSLLTLFFSSLDISESFFGGTYIIKNILLLSALFSLIIGTVVGLAQIRIKRLLAYSTISHVGFLLLALAINSEQSTESLILYLLQYIITSLNAFFILLAFGYIINYSKITFYNSSTQRLGIIKNINSDINFILDLKGQFLSNPILSLSFSICLFSMAGVPPLIGFFGKQSVLYAAMSNGFYFISVLAIIVSVISAYYYLRIIKELHSEETKLTTVNFSSNIININSRSFSTNSEYLLEDTNNKIKLDEMDAVTGNSSLILTNVHSFIISTLTLSILFFVLKPSIILNSTVLLSLSLFNA